MSLHLPGVTPYQHQEWQLLPLMERPLCGRMVMQLRVGLVALKSARLERLKYWPF